MQVNKKNRALVIGVATVMLLLLTVFIEGGEKLIIFLVFTVVTGVITYVLSQYKSPIDMSPTFFLMVIISVTYGFGYAVIFLVVASIIPAIVGGGDIGFEMFMFAGSFVCLSFIARFIAGYGIVPVGVVLTFINLISAWVINNFSGNPSGIIFSMFHAGVTVLYFVVFGHALMGILW